MKHINLLKSPGLIFLAILLFSISNVLSGQTEPAKPLPQFLFPTFSRSIIKMKSGKTNTAVLNYNTVDEEMVFDQRGVYMVLDKPEEIDTVIMQNRKFVPVGRAFYEVLVDGPAVFYIENKSHYVPVGSTTAYGLTSQTNGPSAVLTAQAGNQIRSVELPPNVTVSPVNVFWVKSNSGMNKFTNERQLLKIFPGKENEIKEFIKKSKLNIKTREDLIKLGTFCNELVK